MRAPSFPSLASLVPDPGQAVLATWHQLIDTGRMQDGEPFLAGTARPAEALMSAATAAEAGVADGDRVTVTTALGAITIGVRVHDMPDRVIWLPTHALGCDVRRELGAWNGTLVTLRSPQ
jgi:NADH-quinone oxidoreductase subunit G